MRLEAIAQGFSSRAILCEETFVAKGSTSSDKSFAIVRLYAEWELFCHKVFVTSAYKRPVVSNGARLPKSKLIRSPRDIETALQSVFSPVKKKTPILYWGNAQISIRACKGVGLANQSTIVAALGSVDSPANELRQVRNFIAHRNPDTHKRVHAISSSKDTWELHTWLASPVAGGVSRMSDWSMSLRDIALACTY